MLEVIKVAISALIPIFGLIVSFFFFRLQREATWYKEFRELHKEFWNDEQLEQVRMWISCQEAYDVIEPILRKRNSGEISAEEYYVLDGIDKFCALLTRISHMDARPVSENQKQLFKDLYTEDWLNGIANRAEMATYVRRFWQRLPIPNASPKLNKGSSFAGAQNPLP